MQVRHMHTTRITHMHTIPGMHKCDAGDRASPDRLDWSAINSQQ